MQQNSEIVNLKFHAAKCEHLKENHKVAKHDEIRKQAILYIIR